MDIREIEKIIDVYHKNHPIFTGNKQQAIFGLLATFEDMCFLAVICSMSNPAALGNIRDYMDALNQALCWVENSSLIITEKPLNISFSEDSYNLYASFLNDYASPYAEICSAYISYSRNRMVGEVEGNTVTFNLPHTDNNLTWNDILRECNENGLGTFLGSIDTYRLSSAYEILKESVKIQDGQVCYEVSESILNTFTEMAAQHWNVTKTLPESWEFDLFSLEEYRQVWISIAAFCYIHFFCCSSVQDSLARISNNVIIQPKNNIIEYIAVQTGVKKEIVSKVLDYITFEPEKRNVDIMYQPIVILPDEMVIITPMLFIGSRPERNLLSVVNTRRDSKHSKEVNNLEGLMAQEIEEAVSHNSRLIVVKSKELGGGLPDIDLGIYDPLSNSALLCELKWFMSADSSKEVYAREDDITHGCAQSEKIMAYAMSNKKLFMQRVFTVDDGDCTDLFCCVVARHNIRSQSTHVPVIDLNKLKNLFLSKSLNSVFHIIRNHEYEEKFPNNAAITHKEIKYAGFKFKIPAICFESSI